MRLKDKMLKERIENEMAWLRSIRMEDEKDVKKAAIEIIQSVNKNKDRVIKDKDEEIKRLKKEIKDLREYNNSLVNEYLERDIY